MRELAALVPASYRGPGLSEWELAVIQEEAEAAFPPDLCALLGETVPTGSRFPDWRGRPRAEMQTWRERLVDHIHFDVVHNDFWLPEWRERPPDPRESRAVVAERLTDAPALIPIYGHRGIPNEPLTGGNPVFSVWQTDVIVYGADLAEYLRREFHERDLKARWPVREIRFWTRMLDV